MFLKCFFLIRFLILYLLISKFKKNILVLNFKKKRYSLKTKFKELIFLYVTYFSFRNVYGHNFNFLR